jgi:hypothetical protein
VTSPGPQQHALSPKGLGALRGEELRKEEKRKEYIIIHGTVYSYQCGNILYHSP